MRALPGKKNDPGNAPAGGILRGLPVLFMLLACFLSAALTGCGKKDDTQEVLVKPDGEEHPVSVSEMTEGSGSGRSVYLVVPSEEGTALDEIQILTEAAVEAGASMTVLNYMNDPIAEAAAIELAVREKASVILCDNIDETQTLRGIRKAKENNIPVFLLGRGIESMGMASAQILTERYTCVRKMGEEYAAENKKGSAYVMVRSTGTEDDLAEAFSSVMAGRTGFAELGSSVTNGQEEGEAYDAAWELLHEHPNADTIVCVTSVQALAAADAAADQGLHLRVMCLAGDTDEIVQYVEEGKIYAAIVKPAAELAKRAARSLGEYLSTGELPGTECYYIQGEIRRSGSGESAQSEPEE